MHIRLKYDDSWHFPKRNAHGFVFSFDVTWTFRFWFLKTSAAPEAPTRAAPPALGRIMGTQKCSLRIPASQWSEDGGGLECT
jgi:hypothetical protein